MRKRKQFISLFIITILLLIPFSVLSEDSLTKPFADVPPADWAYEPIHALRSRGITNGVGSNPQGEAIFGIGKTISRSEFTAFLVKLMQCELYRPGTGSFTDNRDPAMWYYPFIETALAHDVILKDSDLFRPADPITREEMAVMIIRTLGYARLAEGLSDLGTPFSDVWKNTGYITIARDFGIITGVVTAEGALLFKPDDNAKREEAAAMMMRMVDKLENKITSLHAFYAISSSSQMELIRSLNSVGFGWSRLEYDPMENQVVLNMTSANSNDYAVPKSFSVPMDVAKENQIPAQLMIFVADQVFPCDPSGIEKPLVEYILTAPEARKQAIASIARAVEGFEMEGIAASFEGVVVDFEGLRGEHLKQSYNEFLTELRMELMKSNKTLTVMVQPVARPGQQYFDGYDYKKIGEIADKIILMAHDYDAKQLTASEMERGYTLTPLTPFTDFYYAIKMITDKSSGVQDLNKIAVQITFNTVQWKLKEGKVINSIPLRPDYEAIRKRLATDDVMISYSPLLQNPNAYYYNPTDETDNVIWYEDARSVQAKIDLLRMFGIQGLSLWRLGTIPAYDGNSTKDNLDVWQTILKNVDNE